MEVSKNQASDTMQSEERFQKYVIARKEQQDAAIAQLDQEEKKEIDVLSAQHKKRLEEMDRGYAVELSRHSKELDEKLKSELQAQESRVKQAQKEGDMAFEKIQEREHARIENYRKNQEERMAKLHAGFVGAEDDMKKKNGEA